MKKAIAIVLLFALSSQCLYQLNCYALFKLNQEYIAQNLCINKKRPELHCKGKCFLMKKIKEAREKQEKQNIKNIKVVLWINNQELNIQKFFIALTPLTKFRFTQKFYQQPSITIPTPPPNVCLVS